MSLRTISYYCFAYYWRVSTRLLHTILVETAVLGHRPLCMFPFQRVMSTYSVFFIDLINAHFMSFIWLAWFGADVLVSVYYSLLWHATILVSFICTWSLLPTKLYWLLYSDTSYLMRALIPYQSFISVVKSCCYCC